MQLKDVYKMAKENSLLEKLNQLVKDNANKVETNEQGLLGRITDLIKQPDDPETVKKAVKKEGTVKLAPPLATKEVKPTLAPPLEVKPKYTDLVFNNDDDNRRDSAKNELTASLQELQNAKSGNDFDDIADEVDDLLDKYEDVLSEREIEAVEKHMESIEDKFDKTQEKQSHDDKQAEKEARKAEKEKLKSLKKERKEERKRLRDSHKEEMKSFKEERKKGRGRGNDRGGPPEHAKGRGKGRSDN